MRFYPNLWFPLLLKELAEKANNRRTYVVRVAYAIFFFGGFALLNLDLLGQSSDLSAFLGEGSAIFEDAMRLQMVGVLLCTPAVMAGLITNEKERQALSLLLITDLRPWRIVLQKFMSGLVTVFEFLLMALPMSAIAYSMGGLSRGDLVSGSWLLVLNAMHSGAIGLLCSSWFRTTGAAALAAYIIAALWYSLLTSAFSASELFTTAAIVPSVIMLAATGASLWLAANVLEARAYTNSQNQPSHRDPWLIRYLIPLFNKLDWLQFTKKRNELPDTHPVRWREFALHPFINFRYMVRLLLPIQTFALLVLLIVFLMGKTEGLSLLIAGLWVMTLLILGIYGSNLIASEQTNQTLDVLLTTPLSGEEILLQKAMAFRRVYFLIAIPFVTIFLGEWSLEQGSFHYIFCSIVTLAVYGPMIFWLSVAVGLHLKDRRRAVPTAVALLLIWAVGPLVLGKFIGDVFNTSLLASVPIGYLSPASIIFANELNDFTSFGFTGQADPSWIMITIANTAIYGLIAYSLRVYCTSRADTLLGRPKEVEQLTETQVEKLRKFQRLAASRHKATRAIQPRPYPPPPS